MKTVRSIIGVCKDPNCGIEVKFALGEGEEPPAREDFMKEIQDKKIGECPGRHVFLNQTIAQAYEFSDPLKVETIERPEDEDVIREVKEAAGERLIYQMGAPETGFPDLKELPGIKHAYQGDFMGPNGEYYRRYDLPSGGRLMVETP